MKFNFSTLSLTILATVTLVACGSNGGSSSDTQQTNPRQSVERSNLIEQPSSVEQSNPVEQSSSVEQPSPVEQSSPIEQSKPVANIGVFCPCVVTVAVAIK